MSPNRMLSALIVIATIAFAIGISLEKSESSSHVETGVPAESGTAHVEGTTESGGEAAATTETGGETSTETAGEMPTETATESSPETVLGVDQEATGFVIAAVIFSLVLAAAVWLRPDVGALLVIVALAMLAFGVLDAREIFHQIDESKEGIAVVAGVVALLHLAAAALAVRTMRAGPQSASN